MNLNNTIKGMLFSILMIFCFSLNAQNGESNTEMIDKLHQEYKSNGVEAALAMYKEMPEDSEYHGLQEPLNVLGYRLLNTDNDADAAAVIFKAQIEEHPDEPNPYDSYADALLEKGNDDEAQVQLEKSVALLKGAEDNDFNNNLEIASKSKLAKLKGLNKVFSFLEGDWVVENYGFDDDGEKELRFTDDMSFIPSKMNSAMIMRISNDEEGWEGTQLIAYDAKDNTYDVVRANNMRLNGLQTAELKIEEFSTNKLEMIQTIEENGEINKSRHVIEKNGNNADWIIYDLTDEGEKKVTHRVMKLKN